MIGPRCGLVDLDSPSPITLSFGVTRKGCLLPPIFSQHLSYLSFSSFYRTGSVFDVCCIEIDSTCIETDSMYALSFLPYAYSLT